MNTGALHGGDRIRTFFAKIAHRYDIANHLLSGGCDFLWRRKAARMVAQRSPERILDLATGSGDLAISLQRACPGALVIGADFCRPMLLESRKKQQQLLVECDALKLPFQDSSFDAVTIAFGLRNMESWPEVLGQCRRVLRPGGQLLVLDFSIPTGMTRAIYRWYLHNVLPHVAAFLTGERTAYDYLGDSIEAFPQGAEMLRFFESAGFSQCEFRPLHTGIVTIYTGKC
jgi:demethylmenaquinone methyltransferase/2-methoxy-6-polyprenyl-1,4-benzoquinol methylase